jgi:hypothetical protein
MAHTLTARPAAHRTTARRGRVIPFVTAEATFLFDPAGPLRAGVR